MVHWLRLSAEEAGSKTPADTQKAADAKPKVVFEVDNEKQDDKKDDKKNDEEDDGKTTRENDTEANEKEEQPKPRKRKPKPTKADEKDEQPKPKKQKPKPTKADEKDEKPKPTKADEKDEQPHKKEKPKPTKADEKDKQPQKKEKPKKTKPDEKDEQPQPQEVSWSNLHEKAMCNGEMSSSPYVEGGEVMVRFESGRVWRVPHLVPDDIEKRGEQEAAAKARPVADFILPSVRVKYASQGTKSPVLKLECKEDRFGPSMGPWRQKLQFVLKEDAPLGMVEASHVMQTMATCYEKMNLNGAEIDFRRCRDSLLKHAKAVNHDWARKPMSWEYVNQQKLDGFPLARPSQRAGAAAKEDDEEDGEEDGEEEEENAMDPTVEGGFERLGSAATDLLTNNGDDLH
ncbi:cpt [Symbiodinium sp. CCMP2592]|nr:cpt [Symbiodinium sp. CCMP2592]